jgi:hypothetical protein
VSRVAGVGAAQLRLLLLVIVACGVVQMHVLGHSAGEHRGYPGAVSPTHAMAGSEPSTGDAPGRHGGAPAPDGSPDLLVVCLAILAAAGLAAAAALFLWLRRARTSLIALSRRLAGGRQWGRDPPLPVPRLGRRLASLSVLRI